MRKILVVILVFSNLFFLTSCGKINSCYWCGKTFKGNTFLKDNKISCEECVFEKVTEDYAEFEVKLDEEISKVETVKLSDEHNMVLAKGISADGDIYELVADETEDYLGTTITIGVIKNNEWLRDMSDEAPFIDDDGFVVGGKTLNEYKDQLQRSKINYIGNGCFCYQRQILNMGANEYELIVWNVETNQVYRNNKSELITYEDFVNDEGLFIVSSVYGQFEANLLNTNDMSLTELNDPISKLARGDVKSTFTEVTYEPYSEGMYAIKDYKISDFQGNEEYNYYTLNSASKKKIGFFDLSGNLVIDLTEYNLYEQGWDYGESKDRFSFKNGQCSFYSRNDQYNWYKITIDKTGKVIDSYKVSNAS